MDGWQDWLNLIAGSLALTCLAALLCGLPVYLVVRLFHKRPKVSSFHPWQNDLRDVAKGTGFVSVLIFFCFVAVGHSLSDMCGISDVTEVTSPDKLHRIAVYNCDCGATTDFSLDVSLLRSNQELPKHRPAQLLYSKYHLRPNPEGNFRVLWMSPTEVTVQVSTVAGAPIIRKQDGVTVNIARLP